MPSRELIYRVSIDTATARREAANIRATFDRELRQIKMGDVNFSGATNQAKQLTNELNNVAVVGKNAADALRAPTDAFSAGIERTISQLKGLATSYIGLQTVTAAIDLSKLGTQANRTYASLNILSGGGEKTVAVLQAIQKASNGTVTELEAAGIATQGFALKLARTPAEFEKLTRAAREITQVSPIINDVGEALTQLALFSSNEASFARADQLGLAVTEVKDRMAELRRENESLSGSQAKLLASIQILDEKYGATLDTVEAQATGIEQLRVAWEDLKVTIATTDFGVASEFFSIDKAAESLAKTLGAITGDYTKTQFAIDRVSEGIKRMQRSQDRWVNMPWDTVFSDQDISASQAALDSYKKAVDEVNKAVSSNAPGAAQYQQQLAALTDQIGTSATITDEQQTALQGIHDWYLKTAQAVVSLSEAEKLRAENKITADQFEQVRQGAIFEQQTAIEQALSGAAAKAAPIAGLEATIAVYRQQKALVDQAIQQLIDSGVSDQGELAVRVAAIVDQLTQPFDALQERATTVDFSAFATAFDGLNQGFADFLPGVASAREELAALSEELSFTGTMTAEQAAQFDYLASVAYAVGDSGSQLNSVVSELGGQFLESNAYAAELVNQLFLTEVAFRNGQISAGTYAGITANLTGTLLTLAQGAGIATNAIYALNQAQSDMSNLPGYAGGFAVGGSISQRIATQQQAAGREQNRREMERYNRDMARAQERSAVRAGKALEDGAKKAAQELKSALDKVPGLFSATQVTEQDMKDTKLGIYQDKADEKLRRLRDEVLNGVDWADVSIEDAKAAIERIGVQAADTKEGILQQFENLWNSQALFADMANVEQWIDKAAVEAQLDLQKKSEEGRNNIYKYFGVQIDEAVTAATGGGSGGAAPVAPPKLVDIDPLTEGLQTGLDEYVNENGQMVKEKIANAPNLFFDPAQLFGGAKSSMIGPQPKTTVTITADPSAQAMMQFMQPGATMGPQVQPQGPQAITLTPTIDSSSLQTEIDKLTPSVSVQLYVTAEEILLFKETINGIVMPKVNVETVLSLTTGTMSDWTVRAESNIPSPNVGVQLHTTVEEIELFKQTISSIVKPTVEVALAIPQQQTNSDGNEGANAITPLITDINTQIRGSQQQIADQGITIAQIIMAGIAAHFKGGQQSNTGAGAAQSATPLADSLLTAVSTQLSTVSNMFYAIGFLPAQNVESGFKGYGYSNMADNLQASIVTAIGAKANDFVTAGTYIGGWIQAGINQSFNAEINLTFAENAGGAWGMAFMKGALSAVGGGTLVQAISDKVIGDLADEMEK